jgi:citronellol/citronellal dehydrogenase
MDTYPEAMQPLIKSLPRHVPAQRMGTEAEVSAAIVFLLSEGAAFVSGACLRIDGAAPNARRHWKIASTQPSPEFDGFHRSRKPRIFGG